MEARLTMTEVMNVLFADRASVHVNSINGLRIGSVETVLVEITSSHLVRSFSCQTRSGPKARKFILINPTVGNRHRTCLAA